MSSDVITRLNEALEGRYRVESELGHGGMATVYLTHDLKHSRKVALKVLDSDVAALIGRERFLAEIKTTAGLQHPAVLPLHDSGAVDGLLYYVMPYLEGASLRDRIDREGLLPLGQVAQIAREVAEGLAYAHSRGVLHRDVKPDNILLSEGHAVLADFGISRAPRSAEDEGLTGTGGVGGTVKYMSPEQVRGGALGPKADQYSLACVVFELLGGHAPFEGSTAWAVIARQLEGTVESISDRRPGVSPATDAVLGRALAHDPADRFANVSEFSDALQATLAPTTAPAADLPHRPRPARSRPWGRYALGVGAVVAAAFAWTQMAPSTELDADRVIVFPLLDQREVPSDVDGEQASIVIGASLEHAPPLRWIDGWDWLDPSQREDMSGWSIQTGADIARQRNARYVIDGRILERADSLGVVLRLHDAADGDLVQTSAAMSTTDDVSTLGRRALVGLLPHLIDPGGPVAVDALQGFAPEVVADWLRGEQEYRESRFEEALASFNSAVEADSTMGLAAIRGALSARWILRNNQAADLLDVAVANEEGLSERYRTLSRGIQAYVHGEATEAERLLLEVTSAYPEWSDAWMALGEVYYHLVPAVSASSARAEDAFSRARGLDRRFRQPLVHLAEMAYRRGELERGDSMRSAFESESTDGVFAAQLDLMASCVRDGADAVNWGEVSGTERGYGVLYAGVHLALGGAHPACAVGAFDEMARWSTTLEGDDPRRIDMAWSTLVGRHSLGMATGNYSEVRRLISEAREFPTQQDYLWVISALGDGLVTDSSAPGAFEAEAAAAVERLSAIPQPSPTALWAMGAWAGLNRDAERVRQVEALARARAATDTRDPPEAYQSLLDVLAAWLAFSEGDVDEAVDRFSALNPTAPPDALPWALWQALGAERLALTRLQMEAGDHEGVLRTGASLDNPQSLLYVAFVGQSLRLRAQAAEELGRQGEAQIFRERLRRLTDSAQ